MSAWRYEICLFVLKYFSLKEKFHSKRNFVSPRSPGISSIYLLDISPFEVQGLLYHNLHRKMHNTQDLQLDHQLSLEAARYARQIAQSLSVKHSPMPSRPGQAENIFLRCKAFSTGVSAFEAVKEW